MIDRAGKTADGLLQLGAVRLRLLQSHCHGGKRRFQFMRDRIEKRFLQFLRLTGNLCSTAFFQRALFVHEKGELRGKGVEQLALLKRRQGIESDCKYTFSAVASDERHMQRFGIRKCVSGSSSALFLLKRPHGDAFIFARGRERARWVTRKATLPAQPNRCISFESFFDQRQNFRQGFIEISAGVKGACETVERGGAFFAAASCLSALARPTAQV